MTLWLGLNLLDVHGIKRERRIDATVLFDLVKLSFAGVTGLGGLVALVVAYRKQRTEKYSALREDTKLHSDRFTAAVAQLGDASPAVQLGGVHALAGLADDAPTRQLRQTCSDLLCAYLRLPYGPDPGDNLTKGLGPSPSMPTPAPSTGRSGRSATPSSASSATTCATTSQSPGRATASTSPMSSSTAVTSAKGRLQRQARLIPERPVRARHGRLPRGPVRGRHGRLLPRPL
ncbi:hypothetical protein [Actinomadura decatromicini]|uniref:hypothetical protein n=1 Tax=Actinomadura decatromicini TaxID=2604572 RepID=UPI0011E66B60|nr:hypothetical protein [Actinomadura decatromicini]